MHMLRSCKSMEIYRDSTGNQVPKMVRSINDAHNVYIKEKSVYKMLNLLKKDHQSVESRSGRCPFYSL